jgi:signal transduction histidine kinase
VADLIVLDEFITAHRELIIARTRERIARRLAPHASETEVIYGVPLFLDQLRDRLRSSIELGATEIGATATLHGSELLKIGLTIGQVVHDYGNVCQVITELAVERAAPISNADFRTLNMCLDIAIAEAVTEFARQREQTITEHGVEQLGYLAHEMRNAVNTATLAFEAVRAGNVGIAGSTGTLLGRSLGTITDLVTRSLAEVRIDRGTPRDDRVLVADLLEETEIAAAMQARHRDIRLSIDSIPRGLTVIGDSQIIASILANLVQNACKFTREHGRVTLSTRTGGDRVSIDVADECGGLPPGKPEQLFGLYAQRSADRSGLGMGLAISLKGARAVGGDIHVRDVPGTGCVFTVELRKAADPDGT